MHHDVPPLKNCCSYIPGHDTHFIQARKGWMDQENPPVPGALVDVGDDGTITVDVDGERFALWHHDPDRLRELAGRAGGRVLYQPQWSLLKVPARVGKYCFSVCDLAKGEPKPCVTEPPTNDLLDALETHGGFILAVDGAEIDR